MDLSTIPANMIDHIEIITGGASSVYGAVCGPGAQRGQCHFEAQCRGSRTKRSIGNFKTRRQCDRERQRYLRSTLVGPRRVHKRLAFSWNRESPLSAERRPWDVQSYNCDFPNANVTPANPYTNIEYFGCRFPNTTYGSAFYIGNTL